MLHAGGAARRSVITRWPRPFSPMPPTQMPTGQRYRGRIQTCHPSRACKQLPPCL
jgi:hypothetical protein